MAYVPLAKLAGASYLDKLGIIECMHAFCGVNVVCCLALVCQLPRLEFYQVLNMRRTILYIHIIFFIAHRQLTTCFVFTKFQQHSKDENNTLVNCLHSSSELRVLAMKMELDLKYCN